MDVTGGQTQDAAQEVTHEPDQEPAPLWRNRDYNLLQSGDMLSGLGSAASSLAYPLVILWATGSAGQAGIAGICAGLGAVAGGIPAGVLGDRYSRRALMVVSSLVQLIAMGSVFPTAAAGHVWIGQIAGVALAQGLAGAVYGAASGPAMRRIVPARQLRTGFARDHALTHGVGLVGPSVGGLLYGLGRAVPFLADTVSYLAVTAAALLLRTPLGPDKEERERPFTFRTDLTEGLRFAFRNSYLRYICISSVFFNTLVMGLLFLFVVALRQHGASAAVIGSANSVISAAGMAGALLSARIIRWLGGYRLVLVFFWGTVPAALAVAVLPGMPYAAAGAIGAVMFFSTPANVALAAYQMQITPDRLQARVNAAVGASLQSLSWAAPAACGALADAFGTTAVLAGIAAGLAVIAIVNHFVRDLRKIDDLEDDRNSRNGNRNGKER
jgi:MFS family permease